MLTIMMDYTFKYNLPSENSSLQLFKTMIEARATLLPSGRIALEFPMLHAAVVTEVIDWHKAIEEMRGIARIEFDLKLAVKETLNLVNNAA